MAFKKSIKVQMLEQKQTHDTNKRNKRVKTSSHSSCRSTLFPPKLKARSEDVFSQSHKGHYVRGPSVNMYN